MSVVVVGMEIPSIGWDCPLNSFGICIAKHGEPDDCYEERPNWCPLRPLPEKHGRLIDADEMESNGYALYSKLHIDSESEQEWRERIPFDEVPTIIEAEEKNYERN